MGIYAIKVPDVGEGIAEVELVEWRVAAGDIVREDDVLAAVMTDKATVEIPSSFSGTVTQLGAEIGEQVAVGSNLLLMEVDGPGNYNGPDIAVAEKAAPSKMSKELAKPQDQPEEKTPESKLAAQPPAAENPPVESLKSPNEGLPSRNANGRPIAAPSVRSAARELGLDLRRVTGSGPAGRITHADLEAHKANGTAQLKHGGLREKNSVEDIKIVGLRRKIAERMAEAKKRIPHITIVEEIDVTALEELRGQLNKDKASTRGKLTVLPFVMRALVRAVAEQPALNAHFLDDEGVVRRFDAVHIGIATQTPGGLMVPVMRHAESLDLWGAAAEILRLAEVSRSGSATREDLSGSTISITSLGPLGGLATTPIINRPEVAIVGVNKMAIRPVWQNGEFVPRQMMNISCSFDHRVIDGWDAAVFVQKLKSLLESPAMMFVEG